MDKLKTNAILLHPSDNVVTVTCRIGPGEAIIWLADKQPCHISAADEIPQFHKAAIRAIPSGSAVVKYGEVIGKANMDIRSGAHVHVHNLSDLRELPGN